MNLIARRIMASEVNQEGFWARVGEADRETGCRPWSGTKDRDGYGIFRTAHASRRRAHRIAWALAHDVTPEGLLVCHRCDNPPCVEAQHLFLGTVRDNTLDGYLKGRVRPPKNADRCKLTADQVREIRGLDEQRLSGTEIGKRFGVSFQLVSSVLRGRGYHYGPHQDRHGYNIRSVAERIGVPIHRIYRLRKLGLDPLGPVRHGRAWRRYSSADISILRRLLRAHKKRQIAPSGVREIQRLHRAGLSQAEIGRRICCAQSTVGRILRRSA